MVFEAQLHTPHDHCVRFAAAVTGDHATLVTGRPLRLTRTGLSPAGSRQLLPGAQAIHLSPGCGMDCFVANAPRNDGGKVTRSSPRHAPRRRGIQYAGTATRLTRGNGYWIIRLRG